MELNQHGRQSCRRKLMKRLLFVFLSYCLYLNASHAASAVVKYIVDGDTFIADVLLDEGIEVNSVSVRLDNVDTPELHGECEYEIERANYAKQRLAELIPVGSIIEIKNIKNDKYQGRIDASVFDAQNKNVGLILIRENLGRPYSGGKRESWCHQN